MGTLLAQFPQGFPLAPKVPCPQKLFSQGEIRKASLYSINYRIYAFYIFIGRELTFYKAVAKTKLALKCPFHYLKQSYVGELLHG